MTAATSPTSGEKVREIALRAADSVAAAGTVCFRNLGVPGTPLVAADAEPMFTALHTCGVSGRVETDLAHSASEVVAAATR